MLTLNIELNTIENIVRHFELRIMITCVANRDYFGMNGIGHATGGQQRLQS